ncbi:MAG: hypothetical protein GWN00_22185 [Aliifodinibius sp.]|nr:hypothetical protein [candidate division Zixibacteria bacterium]NIT58831.1 hypothetical protein [Fodinibius sp.]NIV13673.1 hypothetical protein [Fodinibius sp.]NIY27414.1 hypothetical protein [Fodinibius sp.]
MKIEMLEFTTPPIHQPKKVIPGNGNPQKFSSNRMDGGVQSKSPGTHKRSNTHGPDVSARKETRNMAIRKFFLFFLIHAKVLINGESSIFEILEKAVP